MEESNECIAIIGTFSDGRVDDPFITECRQKWISVANSISQQEQDRKYDLPSPPHKFGLTSCSLSRLFPSIEVGKLSGNLSGSHQWKWGNRHFCIQCNNSMPHGDVHFILQLPLKAREELLATYCSVSQIYFVLTFLWVRPNSVNVSHNVLIPTTTWYKCWMRACMSSRYSVKNWFWGCFHGWNVSKRGSETK